MHNETEQVVTLEIEKAGLKLRLTGPLHWVDKTYATLSAEPVRQGNQESRRESDSAGESAIHGLTEEQIQHIYHLKNGIYEVTVSELPGDEKEQAVNAYLLTGGAALLAGKDGTFTDESARELLKQHGAYDVSNHSKYMPALKGLLSGNKSEGWQLSFPGKKALRHLIAAIIKESES